MGELGISQACEKICEDTKTILKAQEFQETSVMVTRARNQSWGNFRSQGPGNRNNNT